VSLKRPAAVTTLTFDCPVAVFGDIHGCSVALRAVLARLPADMPVLVCGDLCDRGPDTSGVLDILAERCVGGALGNHDEWLLAWASGEGFDPFALSGAMGGVATLASYGVTSRRQDQIEAESWRVPGAHLAFLRKLSTVVDLTTCGVPYWVTHAGVPPVGALRALPAEQRVPALAANNPQVMRWGASEPDQVLPVDRTVIMGHMCQDAPVDTGNVLGIDTGCGTVRGGMLTAVVLPERRFVSEGW
jgi:serine/threonine protein phosphatase 1